jgi:NTE family protein
MSNQNLFTVSTTDKLGLALSGGGFRAALFHIGVLARLAELDLLRHVQVLSTVSGGSIVGAMYYLKLKQLLEEKRPDGLKPSTKAYIILIQELEKEFLRGVQSNIRVRILLNPFKSAKMFLSDDYSRSDRLSELYQETFYKALWDSNPESTVDWLLDALCLKDSRRVFLKDLKINPPDQQPGFNVREYNKKASFKIPMLSINATTLNSGEHWKFTASSVGVQITPGPSHPSPTLYPQLYFDDLKLTQQQRDKLASLTLSDAVAASACVPAIFTPLAIHDLYPPINGEEIVVELVDGGVFDNQGLTTLNDEKCSHRICSDASGQLQFDRTPSSKEISVLFQANDILMERVRGLETSSLSSAPNTGFWHLRDNFTGTAHFPAFSTPVDSSDETSNGQVYLISAIRTDLDAFSDIEAHSLMYDGYCLADRFLNQSAGIKSPSSQPWGFLNIRAEISQNSAKLTRHLHIAGDRLFKSFRLMGQKGRIVGGILAIIALALIWWGLTAVFRANQEIFRIIVMSPKTASGLLVFGLVAWFLLRRLPKRIRLLRKMADTVRKIRTGKVMGAIYIFAIVTSIGSAVAYFHLKVINPMFLRLGKLP